MGTTSFALPENMREHVDVVRVLADTEDTAGVVAHFEQESRGCTEDLRIRQTTVVIIDLP